MARTDSVLNLNRIEKINGSDEQVRSDAAMRIVRMGTQLAFQGIANLGVAA